MQGSNGIAVGNKGSILTTTTKGAQWNVQTSGTLNDLTAVYLYPDAVGSAIAVGKSGSVIETSDGGQSWSAVTGVSGTTINWNDITYSVNFGVAVGDGGHAYSIVRTGSSNVWTALTSTQTGTSANLKAVYVIDNTMAYAVGDGGVIEKITSVDGGNNTSWTALTSGVSSNLTDVFFRDYQTGYAIGAGGILLKTVNGGTTWDAETGTSSDNHQLTALDNNNIIIAGAGGNVTHLNDQKDEVGSKFWYDALGRLVVSQNSKQYNKTDDHNTYSYTLYDALGRITEVGELHATASIDNEYVAKVLSATLFTSWIGAGTKAEVTTTVYDVSQSITGFTQENLRKRVAATYIDTDGNLSNGYTHASYYSYDVHGNVKALLQDIPALGAVNSSQEYKRIDYEYDLISGNVKKISYQDGHNDAFYHKYLYDADNRITHVFTSKDNTIWDEDVKYFYYKHGPLARTELGNEKVQGIDYAYTLQGWIKGINSTNLNTLNDIGKDAETTATTNSDKYIAKDITSYSLNYYNDATNPDYTAIASTSNNFIAATTSIAYSHTGSSAIAKNLYNGNISSMATTILDGSGIVQPQLTGYEYDQLNRIREMRAYRDGTTGNTQLENNNWTGASDDNSYKSSMSYDANGNLQTMLSNGLLTGTAGLDRDNLSYTYATTGNFTRNTNRLVSVADAVTTSIYTDDIKSGQGASNYQYDEIGNLKHDASEDIDNIDWSVYGKIRTITRTSGSTKPALDFTYDAQGNRLSKKVTPATGSAIPYYYVRDAQGNILSIYKINGSDVYLQEQDVYGSSRVGTRTANQNLTSPGTVDATVHTRTLGEKNYELTNHLGNVLSTVSDRRNVISAGGTTTDSYKADLTGSADFFPFGAQISGRGINGSNGYRYGFNGKENDNEVKGQGNQQDYGMRIYDPRLGKFLSVDPLTKKYPEESPYIFSGNSPISVTDEDGREKTYYMTRIEKDGTTTQLKVVEKYTVIQETKYSRENIGAGGVAFFTSPQISNTKTFDVAQHITLDERTGKVTVGKEYTTTERSNSAIVRGLEDNAQQLGNYLDEATNGGGGIVFTSGEGQGQETRSGYNSDAQSENIDILTAVLGAASSAATSKPAVGFLEAFKQGVDAIGILKDVKDNSSEILNPGPVPVTTNKDSCTFCGETGTNLKTVEQGGTHGGPVVQVKSEKNNK